MAKLRGSDKGFRIIKTGLRRVLRHKDSTPAQLNSAAKWLLFIETGRRSAPVDPSDLPPVRAEEVEQNSPLIDPVISPEDMDPELVALMSKIKV